MDSNSHPAPAGILQTAWNRLPKWLRPYLIVLSAQAVLVAIAMALRQAFGVQVPPALAVVVSVVYYLLLLGAAWLGYGPGILVCFLALTVVPRLVPARRPGRPFDPMMAGLVLLVSLLISRIAQTRRRREAELRRIAEDLERRVGERTAEAIRAAGEVRQAEERLELLLDAADVGHWDYDLEKNTVIRSLKHDQMFGYHELQPHWNYETFLAHVHPEDRTALESRLREVMTEETPAIEFRIIRTDGTVRWLWMQGRTHKNAVGKPVRVTGVITDITSRKLADESLREQAQLLDLAHDAILSLDLNGTIRFWNRGAEKMYGWSRDEATGRVSHDLLKTAFQESQEEIERRAHARGYWEGELMHTCKNGEEIRVNSRWAVRRGAEGQPLGILEINTDITEKRRIEEQLRHTQKLESLGVLAGGVAHDFNNLLTGILGNSSLALDSLGPHHPTRRLIEEAMKAAEHAADLTRQLLAYAGKGRFVLRTVNLSDLVLEIAGLVQTSIPKTVRLHTQLAKDLKGVDADPGQLQQIVMNLVINAAEAIGPEGGTVLVQTFAQQVDSNYIATMSSGMCALSPGEYICLEVHDTGCGMSDETLTKIFDPFFTTKFAGRGLGLSAVLGIVTSHRGALKVYSLAGQGTTFKVLLPASDSPLAKQPKPYDGDLTGAGTVLVVDDEDIVRQTARHTLEHYGYSTLSAGDGATAVDMYRRRQADIAVVLLDLTMPVMNGEEALRQMQLVNPKVRVLLSSGYNEVEAIQRFAGKGLAGFIQKPYTATALAEKVKQAVAKSRTAQD